MIGASKKAADVLALFGYDEKTTKLLDSGGHAMVFVNGARDKVLKVYRPESWEQYEQEKGVALKLQELTSASDFFVKTLAFYGSKTAKCSDAVAVLLNQVAKSKGNKTYNAETKQMALEILNSETKGHYLMVQEFGGIDMVKWISAKYPTSPVPRDVFSKISFQTIWALYCANSELGFLHCDLKPGNIIFKDAERDTQLTFSVIREDGKSSDVFSMNIQRGDPLIKFIDYGMCVFQDTDAVPAAGGGTDIYSPPECINAFLQADPDDAYVDAVIQEYLAEKKQQIEAENPIPKLGTQIQTGKGKNKATVTITSVEVDAAIAKVNKLIKDTEQQVRDEAELEAIARFQGEQYELSMTRRNELGDIWSLGTILVMIYCHGRVWFKDEDAGGALERFFINTVAYMETPLFYLFKYGENASPVQGFTFREGDELGTFMFQLGVFCEKLLGVPFTLDNEATINYSSAVKQNVGTDAISEIEFDRKDGKDQVLWLLRDLLQLAASKRSEFGNFGGKEAYGNAIFHPLFFEQFYTGASNAGSLATTYNFAKGHLGPRRLNASSKLEDVTIVKDNVVPAKNTDLPEEIAVVPKQRARKKSRRGRDDVSVSNKTVEELASDFEFYTAVVINLYNSPGTISDPDALERFHRTYFVQPMVHFLSVVPDSLDIGVTQDQYTADRDRLVFDELLQNKFIRYFFENNEVQDLTPKNIAFLTSQGEIDGWLRIYLYKMASILDYMAFVVREAGGVEIEDDDEDATFATIKYGYVFDTIFIDDVSKWETFVKKFATAIDLEKAATMSFGINRGKEALDDRIPLEAADLPAAAVAPSQQQVPVASSATRSALAPLFAKFRMDLVALVSPFITKIEAEKNAISVANFTGQNLKELSSLLVDFEFLLEDGRFGDAETKTLGSVFLSSAREVPVFTDVKTGMVHAKLYVLDANKKDTAIGLVTDVVKERAKNYFQEYQDKNKAGVKLVRTGTGRAIFTGAASLFQMVSSFIMAAGYFEKFCFTGQPPTKMSAELQSNFEALHKIGTAVGVKIELDILRNSFNEVTNAVAGNTGIGAQFLLEQIERSPFFNNSYDMDAIEQNILSSLKTKMEENMSYGALVDEEIRALEHLGLTHAQPLQKIAAMPVELQTRYFHTLAIASSILDGHESAELVDRCYAEWPFDTFHTKPGQVIDI